MRRELVLAAEEAAVRAVNDPKVATRLQADEEKFADHVAKTDPAMAQRLRSHPLLRLHSLADMERRHALHFRAAELYWVTRDMTRVALDASTDMPPWTPSAVIPVPIGLLIWAEDLPRIVWRGHDNNPMVPIDGVLWEQSGGYVNRRVSIIDLRRQDNHSGATETAAREYKHRWYVRGHWRQQPHGVKRGSIWRAFAGLSGGIEAARNAFVNRHNSVTCTYTF